MCVRTATESGEIARIPRPPIKIGGIKMGLVLSDSSKTPNITDSLYPIEFDEP